ncbi:MAG: response regulator [Symploca sp. SIO2E9]|nr:response regulator [Symploca sp. SIO2E9]
MAAQPNPPLVYMSLLTAQKQFQFLKTLKRLRFSGQLVLAGSTGQQWIVYFYLGEIIYATGGTHPVRRWQRNLIAHSPQIPAQSSAWQSDLIGIDSGSLTISWEYRLLCLWVGQQKMTRFQAAKIVTSVSAEVLFDAAQAMRVTARIKPNSSLSQPSILIGVEETIAEVQTLWQAWQKAKLLEYSPNHAPVIEQPQSLQKYSSEPVYQTLTKILNGQNTLRDVAVQMHRDIVEITRSLLPYIRLEWVKLTSIADLPAPISTAPEKPSATKASAEHTEALVACVDDSIWVCQTMKKLITAAGYRFVSVNNALRAPAVLLARKPDLIFLDIVMPNANGYEICEQLRKLSLFRDTPIVFLTWKDGEAARLRAKLVGASDFLNKPLDAQKLLSVIRKHLYSDVVIPSE